MNQKRFLIYKGDMEIEFQERVKRIKDKYNKPKEKPTELKPKRRK